MERSKLGRHELRVVPEGDSGAWATVVALTSPASDAELLSMSSELLAVLEPALRQAGWRPAQFPEDMTFDDWYALLMRAGEKIGRDWAAKNGYVRLTDSEGLFDETLCDALEVFLRERGVYPTKGGRVAPGDKAVGAEDVLEVLLAAVKEET